MKDVTTGELHDYSRKRGVLSVETVTPEGVNAPDWSRDPVRLANAMEAADTRVNSQPASSVILALPAAVSAEAREGIARELAQDTTNRYKLAAIVALHAPGEEGDERNFHAHFLFSTREIGEDGFGRKCRAFSSPPGRPNPEVTWFRKRAAELINEALEEAGSDELVDWRSLAARGIERVPTEHLGPSASAMEREGKRSDRGDRNREIAEVNRRIEENNRLVAELEAINAEIIAGEERRLDERYGKAEPDAYERELARQFGPAPELGDQAEHDLARDLAARFGDELRPRIQESGAGHEGDLGELADAAPRDTVLETQDEAPGCIQPEPGEPNIRFVRPSAWQAFADRIRSAAGFIRDTAEGFGELVAKARDRAAELLRDERGEPAPWTSRLRMATDAISAILSRGENRRAVVDLGHELGEEIAHDLTTVAQLPTPDPRQDPRSGRAWSELEQTRAQERSREPDEKTPERPADPIGAAFEAAWHDMPESEPTYDDWPEAEPPQQPEAAPEPDNGPEPDGPDLDY